MKERVGDEQLIIISVAVRGINDHIRFYSQMLCTANLQQRRAETGWDRQTDGRTDGRPDSCIEPAPHGCGECQQRASEKQKVPMYCLNYITEATCLILSSFSVIVVFRRWKW